VSYNYAFPHMAVTVDVVVSCGAGDERRVLLVRRARTPFADCWALPGGFVDMHETVLEAARRELAEETGIHGADLRFFGYFDAVDRDPRERTLSLAFIAELDEGGAGPKAGDDAAAVAWFPVHSLPPLAFDHAKIVARAIAAVAAPSASGRTP